MSGFGSRDILLYLEDIEFSVQRVQEWAGGVSREELFADEMRLDAIVRHLIIIGEAVKQIPADVRQRVPEIPWTKVARFRDIMVHHYYGAVESVIWDVISVRVRELQTHLGPLRVEMEREQEQRDAGQ